MSLARWGLFLVSLCLSGCATWTYDGRNFKTAAAGIEAARSDVADVVEGVEPLGQPLAGSALILVPSLNWSRRAVAITGNAQEEQIRYVASIVYYGLYAMGEAVERRRIFRDTSVEEFARRNPEPSPEYDYLIWFRLVNQDSGTWMISRGSSPEEATKLRVSPVSDPPDRVAQFLEEIEDHVRP